MNGPHECLKLACAYIEASFPAMSADEICAEGEILARRIETVIDDRLEMIGDGRVLKAMREAEVAP